MASADITQALVDKAQETNYLAWGGECDPNATDQTAALFTSPGAVWLRSLRDAALGKINGKTMTISALTNANVNGESFTRAIAVDPADMLNQVNQALRELLGTEVRVTYSHFHGIPH